MGFCKDCKHIRHYSDGIYMCKRTGWPRWEWHRCHKFQEKENREEKENMLKLKIHGKKYILTREDDILFNGRGYYLITQNNKSTKGIDYPRIPFLKMAWLILRGKLREDRPFYSIALRRTLTVYKVAGTETQEVHEAAKVFLSEMIKADKTVLKLERRNK